MLKRVSPLWAALITLVIAIVGGALVRVFIYDMAWWWIGVIAVVCGAAAAWQSSSARRDARERSAS